MGFWGSIGGGIVDAAKWSVGGIKGVGSLKDYGKIGKAFKGGGGSYRRTGGHIPRPRGTRSDGVLGSMAYSSGLQAWATPTSKSSPSVPKPSMSLYKKKKKPSSGLGL